MDSSDEEGESLPKCVTDYYLVTGDKIPVLLTALPLILSDKVEVKPEKSLDDPTYLRNGDNTVFLEVIAWKFNLFYVHPEIYVQSKAKAWIKLQKPRKSYLEFVRTIMVTVYCLHSVKRDPKADATSLWTHLVNHPSRLFRAFAQGASEKDILLHAPVIHAAVSVDGDLIQSEYLLAITGRQNGEEVTSNEAISIARKPNFIDDGAADEIMEDCDTVQGDEMNDVFDHVCSFCDDGGKILCCDGRCMRSFHPTRDDGKESKCQSLGLSDAQAIASFLCPNCENQRHQCFACGLLGSSDVACGAEVFPCISANCGHFYHPACAAKFLHSEDPVKAADLEKQIAEGESFTCPVHKCSVCKKLEDKTSNDLQFAVSRRCPISYHQKCLPRSIKQSALQRAWNQKNGVLIYCMKHKVDPALKTPERNHIHFPDTKMRSNTKEARHLLHKRGNDTKTARTMNLKKKPRTDTPKQVNAEASPPPSNAERRNSPDSTLKIALAKAKPILDAREKN